MIALRNGERQVAPTLDGIRRDHVARYRWAAATLPPGCVVIDAACGVGYGARILAEAGHRVIAIDRSAEAIAYAREHYAHERVEHICADVMAVRLDPADALVSFETIEHLTDPLPFLRSASARCERILASVPNEAVFPFRSDANDHRGYLHHHRHYTRADFAALLRAAGLTPAAWYGQIGATSEVEADVEGRTLVVAAVRAAIPEAETAAHDTSPAPLAAPHHVAIVALGPSSDAYFRQVKALGGRRGLADEVWAVNGLGDVIACDRIFHMDDVAVQEARAEARPGTNIAEMVRWLRTHPGPIYTSRLRPGYPGLVEFPLEAVLNAGGVPYLNNTVAYAVAYARFIGVKKLSIYGVDFTRANRHDGERGRACVEFWLGLCTASGMEIDLPAETALMDACAPPAELFYGYDGVDIVLRDAPNGGLEVEMTEKPLPTAAEIEARYDHSQHPNRLLAAEAKR